MNYEQVLSGIEGVADFLSGTRYAVGESGKEEMKEAVIRYACRESARRLRDIIENARCDNDSIELPAYLRTGRIEPRTIYEKMREATHLANMVEAAECGYIALDANSIKNLDLQLLDMIEEIRAEQSRKVA